MLNYIVSIAYKWDYYYLFSLQHNITPKSVPSTSTSHLTASRTPKAMKKRDPNLFYCHKCAFVTTRLSLIVIHNKSHILEENEQKSKTGKYTMARNYFQ